MLPRFVSRTLALLGAALAAFHGWLFIGQAAAGRLDDPWLMFRWVAAAILIVALVSSRRSGASACGRRSIAIWVLAALLHGPAVAAATPHIGAFALPQSIAASMMQLLGSAVLLAGLWKLGSLLRARPRIAVRFRTFSSAFGAAGQLAAGITPLLSPRPPPLR